MPADFKETVWNYYTKHGRHDLPWRKSITPYKILVSEIMLQQTQADRVIPKYKSFLKKFPNLKALAKAEQSEILAEWVGLGYNRRALYLHKIAKEIVKNFNNKIPKDLKTLTTFSGIGPYTASAILTFAYDIPSICIETNFRTVFIHHFFSDSSNPAKPGEESSQNKVDDKEILKLVEKTLDTKKPREWYWALMDYGAHLKQTIGNASQKSKHYTKQSKFKGSLREVRGALIKALTEQKTVTGSVSLDTFIKENGFPKEKVLQAAEGLARDNLIKTKKKKESLTLELI